MAKSLTESIPLVATRGGMRVKFKPADEHIHSDSPQPLRRYDD